MCPAQATRIASTTAAQVERAPLVRGGARNKMGEGITLARWSSLLLEEVFRDRKGEGRPVSTIDAGGALLARSLAHPGVHVTEDAALQMFISAFPARWQMVRWFSGVDSPGEATVAFLLLCCVVASEAAGSDANAYRERFREFMGWDAVAVDCAGLPWLWHPLQTLLASSSPEKHLRGGFQNSRASRGATRNMHAAWSSDCMM